jgi:hypothetical protein
VLFGSLVAQSCDVPFACDYFHTPLAFALCDVPTPFIGSLVVPSYDAPFAYTSS